MSASAGAAALRMKSVKHGIGLLTASAEANPLLSSSSSSPSLLDSLRRRNPPITRLTRVAHKAPTRLVPVGKSSVEAAGAAVCALSNYGAGMLQGDSAELSVRVERGAKLGLITQGASRIYTQTVPTECEARMHARVERDGMLVFTPDPCAMYANSSYSQVQTFDVHPQSSVVLIDWFSSGRFNNEERWEFHKLSTRTSLRWLEDGNTADERSSFPSNTIPFLQDSTMMDLRLDSSTEATHSGENGSDAHAVAGFNCFASLILYGVQTRAVHLRSRSLADEFAAKYTRIRDREDAEQHHPGDDDIISSNNNAPSVDGLRLSGRVVMGVSRVPLPGKPSDAHVIRLAATTNEDLYRVFHDCLLPLAPAFGFEFYKDRIRAQRSEIPRKKDTTRSETLVNGFKQGKIPRMPFPIQDIYPKLPESPVVNSNVNSTFWSIAMLADSSLPTGSFAHSAGLEAAAQLGLIQGEAKVHRYIQAATRSSMQMVTPFLIGGHRISSSDFCDVSEIRDRWSRLHQQSHAVMVTNEPACAASLDQGKSLARVASQWLEAFSFPSDTDGKRIDEILKCLKSSGGSSHMAPTVGVIGGMVGLDEAQVCRLFAYCMARDLVSAAVRLSLVGPLASVPLLHSVQGSAENGIRAVFSKVQDDPDDLLLSSAASAPVVEALHPCHEILQTRLFRS
jgi:urease accessory protein